MDWLRVMQTLVLCVGIFWVPGLVVGHASGLRGARLVAIAPAVGAGVLGAASILCGVASLGWTVLHAAVATAATASALVVLRRRDAGPPVASRPMLSRGVLVLGGAVGIGVLGQVVPVVIAMGRPDRVLNAWDALFHLSAVQAARAEGLVTPMSLSELAAPGEARVNFYPHAWHAVTALVPQWSGPVVVVNVAAIVPVVVATVVGVVALARVLFPDAPEVAPVAAVLTASGLAVPLAIALQPGLIPNAFALSLVPGVLACVIDARRAQTSARAALGLAALGVTFAHPNAGLALLVLSMPWVLPVLAPVVLQLTKGWRGRGVLAIALAVVLAVLVLVLASPTARVVADIHQKPPQGAGELAARLATGNLGEWTSYAIVPTLLAALGAVVAFRKRRGRALVVAVLVAVALYASAASPFDAVSRLTGLWYTETRRIAPLVGMLVVLLAAFGTVWLARTAATKAKLPAQMSEVGARRTLGILVLAFAVGLAPATLRALADDSFSQAVPEEPQAFDRVPYLSEAEEDMIRSLGGTLDPDALLLGSSFSGAGHLAALTGQRVNQPYHSTSLGPREVYVSEHLADLGVDSRVCENVRALGARAVYVDPHALHSTYWREAVPADFATAPRHGVVLASAGDVAIYSLDACY